MATDTRLKVQIKSKLETLILIGGFIHDATVFEQEHPGGALLIKNSRGRDMTSAFFGGVYNHSNAAHNVSYLHLVPLLRLT